jgi:hypothetical protein
MHFTNAELDTLRDAARSSETFARMWRTFRWVALLLGGAFLALAVLQFNRAEDIATLGSSALPEMSAASRAEDIDRLLDLRIALLRREYRSYIGAILNGSTGGIFVSLSLIGWQRRLHPDSQSVLLRRIIESHDESRTDT